MLRDLLTELRVLAEAKPRVAIPGLRAGDRTTRLAGGGRAFPSWTPPGGEEQDYDPDDEYDETLERIDIHTGDPVQVTRFMVMDVAHGPWTLNAPPRPRTFPDLDAALAALRKADDITDVDLAKVKKYAKKAPKGVRLHFDRYTGRLSALDEVR